MFRKIVLACALVAGLAGSGCFFGKKTTKAAPADTSVAPDAVLYNRALNDIKHGRYDIARLSLQTLINTYPDSEYLAKSKLSIADSYYKEGGTTGLTQAIAEYKDFITFFPFLDEAQYAQMQVGMAYYRMMVKPDRDSTSMINAEAEFQTFIQKYPNSKFEPQAEQRLREVQEVLAEGDFRIARFYYIRGSERAAAGRLLELVQRYPLYSHADEANWMLGQLYEKVEKKEVAANYYAAIVKNYPLSSLAGDAKNKLVSLGAPVPQPDPGALARMQAEQNTPHPRERLIMKPLGMLKSGPDVATAAHVGMPNLEPPGEAGGESLTPGTLTVGPGAGTTQAVATVIPGTQSSTTSSTDVPAPGGTGEATVGTNSPDSPTQTAPGSEDNSHGGAGVGGNESPAPPSQDQAANGAAGVANSTACTPATGSTGAAAAPGSTASNACPSTTTTSNPKNESSSKKKKKRFPW
jgi:outer membrane protein assembly factor BamD